MHTVGGFFMEPANFVNILYRLVNCPWAGGNAYGKVMEMDPT